MSFESVVRNRDIPPEPSSSEIIKMISSRCGFLMRVESVVRNPNIPPERSSSENIKMIGPRYGFIMGFDDF